MCLEDQTAAMIQGRETFNTMTKSIGNAIQSVLLSAVEEKRLTVGLLPALQTLSHSAAGALFCLLAPPRPGGADPAHHMQQVLLEAFCRENDIYIVNVDSAEKLRLMLPNCDSRDCTCILVHQPYTDPYNTGPPSPTSLDSLPDPDRQLAQHCEQAWGHWPPPIVRLPEQ